jgi:hypothetical protein
MLKENGRYADWLLIQSFELATAGMGRMETVWPKVGSRPGQTSENDPRRREKRQPTRYIGIPLYSTHL